MGGAELLSSNDNKRMQESQCPLCKFTFREPLSAGCKHPACKSCLAALFTRNLPALESLCPVCPALLNLHELKPDQSAQRNLKKIKSCKCKNCNWKGSYTDYIENHERNCGGVARIQCKVLGCGKWLPEKRALDVHRTDEWCPMILIMKARLNHAEIVHLSMRETWDWTCGLVLRSEKPSVRNLIVRSVLVFSALDPKVPITLENDEYAANQTSEPGCLSDSISMFCNQFKTRSGESNEVRPRQNGSSGRSSPDDQPDGQSLGRQLSSAILSPGASAPKGASNCYFSSFQDDDLESSEEKRFRGAANEKGDRDRELKKVKKEIEGLSERLEEMKDMPKAFASIYYKQELFQGILPTLNKDVMAVHSRLDKLNLSPNFRDPGIYDKLQNKFQELERSVASLRQYGEKIDERLLTLETSYSGVYLWEISNYSEKKGVAMNKSGKSIYSPPFFTSQHGYKLCGRVFLMGEGAGKGSHISLFITIMKGPNDAVLPWPFKEKITFQLVNQDDPINKSITGTFRPDPTSSPFKKPNTEKNIGAGRPLFAEIKMIEDPKSGFIRDNTVYLKIISQTSE